MKDVISGKRKHFKIQQISYIQVPKFPELSPYNIIEKFNLKQNQLMLNYCPEIEKKEPYDREFFFNIFNTLNENMMQKMIFEQT